MCMSVCAHNILVCECLCVCTRTWRPCVYARSLPQWLSTSGVDLLFHWTQSSLAKWSWLATQLQDSPCLTFSNCGITGTSSHQAFKAYLMDLNVAPLTSGSQQSSICANFPTLSCFFSTRAWASAVSWASTLQSCLYCTLGVLQCICFVPTVREGWPQTMPYITATLL